MAQKYKKRKLTGDEYVKASIDLYNYSIKLREKLPKIWEKDITDNLINSAKYIMENSIKGNDVYMEEQEKKNKIKSYEDRLKYLIPVLREFKVFDNWFNILVSKIELEKSESARLTSIFCQIIQDQGGQVIKEYKPTGKTSIEYNELTKDDKIKLLKYWIEKAENYINNENDLLIDNMIKMEFIPLIESKTDNKGKEKNIVLFPKPYTNFAISVLNNPSEMKFTASNGNKYILSKVFTLGNREHLAALETNARDKISKRISNDKKSLKYLTI